MPTALSTQNVPYKEEEVVISGISGTFPSSNNVYEFRDNLMNKIDMVTDNNSRWVVNHPEIPSRGGKINDIEKFDANFFGIPSKQVDFIDPMGRILLEKSYEAIVDAGYNPSDLYGTKTGVYIGSSIFESEKIWCFDKSDSNQFGMLGNNRALLANRISYWLGIKGPSIVFDSGCSSTAYALEQAYRDLKDQMCDYAIVGGVNLCLTPFITLHFSRLGMLNMKGMCRSFDNEGNGYVRSDTISTLFLQRAKDSRRIYATVCHVKTNNDGYKDEGITFPSTEIQQKLIKSFYEECKISPQSLAYLEAHGTGTLVGDPTEANTIDLMFCKNRNTPLKVGAVKSNMGHSESASTCSSLAKVILSFETGIIPPNLHYKSPRKGISAIEEGRIEIVIEPSMLEGSYVGINSFGFGGANAHILLQKNEKNKIHNGAPEDSIPRLVCVSGRTEESVKVMLDDIESRPLDVEYVRLLQELYKNDMKGHLYRGFTILQKTEPRCIAKNIVRFSNKKRPICFIFSGLGSQWNGMGTSLMKIPIFLTVIDKCDAILRPLGVDIVKILTSKESKLFDNILYSFVGIAVIQIGLVDILTQLQIHPDYIIGHSIGELGCAYADKCLTAEQVILIAYYQAVVFMESKLIKGSMVAVGLGYDKIKDLLPPEIDIACHSSLNSTIISGPVDIMKNFVKFLIVHGIGTQTLKTSNIAFHSRYCYKIKTFLVNYLSKIIHAPKIRSSKWIFTSVPEARWDTKYGSADYFTNTLLCPVFFEKGLQEIPSNAATIEIAPQGLLQAILKWSLPKTNINITLTSQSEDSVKVLLTSIGKLYQEGVLPNLVDFYPKVEFPVSRGTPMISPLVRWDHSEDWFVPSINSKAHKNCETGERIIQISNKNREFGYICGHIIDGRNLFPATGYLELVWEMFAMMRGEYMHDMSIVFEDVRFLQATHIPKDGSDVELIIMIQKGTGNFEIIKSQSAVVTGRIKMVDNTDKEWIILPKIEPTSDQGDLISLKRRDIYRELNIRGYNYDGAFRSIISVDSSRKFAKVQWVNNYVTFMDCMLQLQVLCDDSRSLLVPTRIERIVICPRIHQTSILQLEDMDDQQYIPVYIYKNMNIIQGGGIEIIGLQVDSIQRRKILNEPVLERQSFIPYYNSDTLNLNDALRILVQLVLENTHTIKVKTLELDSTLQGPITPILCSVLGDIPLIQAENVLISNHQIETSPSIKIESNLPSNESNTTLAIATNLLERPETLAVLQKLLSTNGCIISRESHQITIKEPNNITILSKVITKDEQFVLLKPKSLPPKEYAIVEITSDPSFGWLQNVKDAMKNTEYLILYCHNDPLNGLIGFVNCLRREPSGEAITAVFIADSKAPKFDPKLPFYKEQLDKNIAINIYKNGQWGSLRHLQLEPNLILTNNAYVDIKTIGDLSTLYWYESSSYFNKSDNIAEIYYSALNFHDIMTTSGKIGTKVIQQTYPSSNTHGLEFSGRDQKGNRIMGIVAKGALATRIKYDPELTWKVPVNWSLEDAATVPVVYTTVYYALFCKGQMKPGQTILIHAGCGGVGQAAINVALHNRCTVFTTVGTPEKRAFIKRHFPEIPDAHIGNSRDTSFELMVLNKTNGKGVDLVLNSLSEEKLQASLRCLSYGGKFLEIGKYDLGKNNKIGMSVFLKEISVYGIMLDILCHASLEEKQLVAKYVTQGIENGAVKPLKRTIFKENEVEKAFRFMAAGKHIGKVLIKIRKEEEQNIAFVKPHSILALPRFFCNNEESCIIVGGLGGFGLELADWLISRGLRKLVLSSRNGIKNGYQSFVVNKWRSHGIDVKISTANVATIKGCSDLILAAQTMGQVFAIFNLSVVLRDALLKNQTVENFITSFEGKVLGTKNLDELSRTMCPNLKHFVVFSSASCGRGNVGQTNYGMANSVMERICEQRKSEGLPALAIQWGVVGDVGLVAEMEANKKVLEIGGTLEQKISNCLEKLDVFLRQDFPVVSSMVVAEKNKSTGENSSILEVIKNILGIQDLKKISINSTLSDLGMDSIMAVEVKQILEREYEMFLSAKEIRALTIAKLGNITNEKSSGIFNINIQNINTGLLTKILGDENNNEEIYIPTTLVSSSTHECPVFFLAGVEGKISTYNNVFRNLNYRALGLQLQSDSSATTVAAMADPLLHIMQSTMGQLKNFKIVAYSFGTLLAIELISRLEALGYTGKAILIDGSPLFVKSLTTDQFDCSNDSTLETSILYHILLIISLINSNEYRVNKTMPHIQNIMPIFFETELEKCDSWSDKLNLLLSKLPKNIRSSSDYIQNICDDILQRVKALLKYSPDTSKKIKSKLHLVRVMNSTVTNIANDYELSMYTESPCIVSKINGTHSSIVDNPALTNIINEFFAS